MMGPRWTLAAVLLAATATACTTDATGPVVIDDPWEGALEAGKTLEIKGVNGRIEAGRASGETAHVSFRKQGTHDDPNEVRIDVVTHSGGVTICAVYPTPSGEPPNVCEPGLGGRMNVEDNDVSVDFTIELPEGVDLKVLNVNGDVEAEGIRSNAFLTTVNGDVRLSTSELGTGTTVNGDIDASLGLSDFDRDLSFVTVNGNVTVTLRASVNARVTCTTVNGTLSSDFTMMTDPNARTMTETLGSGGSSISLTAVNGDVRVRRAT